jgi:hypothetical protein
MVVVKSNIKIGVSHEVNVSLGTMFLHRLVAVRRPNLRGDSVFALLNVSVRLTPFVPAD